MLTHRLTQVPLSRTELLDALGVRDAVAEACFESLVRVAVEALHTPSAMLSFFENEWVWVKAAVGWQDRRYPTGDSLCRFVEGMPGPLAIRDVHADPRFGSLPVVRSHPEVAAYAGIAIKYAGKFIGTLSALDTVPRTFTREEYAILSHLASVTEGLLDSRMARWQMQQDEIEARALAEISSDWTWVTDPDNRYVRIRGATFQAKVGRTPESLIGEKILGGPEVDFLGQPVEPPQSFEDLLATREPFANRLIRIPTASGHVVANRSGVPLVHRGRFEGYLGVSTDMTALIEANKRLHQATVMKEAAERASQGKTAFISQVSHEFRTPLNAIMGFTQLLQLDESGFTDTQRAHLGHIRDASDRLLALTNDMLNLGRIENGVIELARTGVLLAPIVRSAAFMVANDASRKHVTVDIDLADDVQVLADAKALDRVVSNLLSNAVKYNRESGQVRIHATSDTDTVVLHVEDTGHGMTPAQLAKLYEPYNRLGAERSAVPGTGLGLVIAKALVQAMGGSLDVTSAPEAGSHFRVSLPRHDRRS
ncbi:ATP-binding protein [Rhizobacter sp. LjRoot28]|uniref:sensor histidine kinase n=1 Tax=Rhizobacter sp. LjRoot28 TaxID=3342309 RepID=UPI003ED009C9